MRHAVAILLLASPAISAEPVYSWRSRTDEPNQTYLHLDGKQIGGWDNRARHYRSYDGTNWGPPTNTAPVRPPEQRVVVGPPQRLLVMTQPSSPLPPLRGPLRVRLGTAMGQVIADTTMNLFKEIPGAVLDSLKRGDYQLDFKSSVTRSPPPSEAQVTPPSSSQPARTPQRRWFIPRQ